MGTTKITKKTKSKSFCHQIVLQKIYAKRFPGKTINSDYNKALIGSSGVIIFILTKPPYPFTSR